ncbi:hypothetical protein BMF94_6665 [Rhodotorula taiwanensis]|uniref:Uncharacterized protein n=1 Tax=Rhodotorula taiwanensis TaxID=741276 RepID=A0A2S5B0S3_9BASI|nr:hypothetical protein BMF94_6665 [Rhodotorula taiwanensis]
MLNSIQRRSYLVFLVAVSVMSVLVVPTAHAAASLSSTGMSYCRCACFGNSTIIPLYRPANPANPCLTCTRQFCLDQKLAACVGAQNPEEDPDTATGSGSDVEARCFQRDSPKSHFIVVTFLAITSILLFIAALKQYGIDLQAIASRAGLKRTVIELAQRISSLRTRGRQSYAPMAT